MEGEEGSEEKVPSVEKMEEDENPSRVPTVPSLSGVESDARRVEAQSPPWDIAASMLQQSNQNPLGSPQQSSNPFSQMVENFFASASRPEISSRQLSFISLRLGGGVRMGGVGTPTVNASSASLFHSQTSTSRFRFMAGRRSSDPGPSAQPLSQSSSSANFQVFKGMVLELCNAVEYSKKVQSRMFKNRAVDTESSEEETSNNWKDPSWSRSRRIKRQLRVHRKVIKRIGGGETPIPLSDIKEEDDDVGNKPSTSKGQPRKERSKHCLCFICKKHDCIFSSHKTRHRRKSGKDSEKTSLGATGEAPTLSSVLSDFRNLEIESAQSSGGSSYSSINQNVEQDVLAQGQNIVAFGHIGGNPGAEPRSQNMDVPSTSTHQPEEGTSIERLFPSLNISNEDEDISEDGGRQGGI